MKEFIKITAGLGLVLICSFVAFSQRVPIGPYIDGESSSVVRTWKSYTIENYTCPSNETCSWVVTSGSAQLKNASNSGVEVYWNSGTSGTFIYRRDLEDSYETIASKTISIGARPSDPPAPTEHSSSTCYARVLQRANPTETNVVFYWQSSDGGTSTANSNSTKSFSSTGTGYLRAYNTVSGIWSSGTSSKSVTVYDTPPSSAYVGNTSITFCSTDAGGLVVINSASSNSAEKYHLYNSSDVKVDTKDKDDVNGANQIFFDPQPEGAYYVKVSNTCTTELLMQDDITISETSDDVTHLIDDGIATPTNSYCTGSVTFEALEGAASTSYQWKINGSNVGTNSSTFSPGTTHAGSGLTLSVTYKMSRPCSGDLYENTATWTGLTFTAPTTPNVSISPGSDNTVCSESTVGFSFDVSGATSYTHSWGHTSSSAIEVDRTITANNTITSITIDVNDACATESEVSAQVEHDIYPSPNTTDPSVGFPTSYCEGSSATIIIQNPQQNDIYYINGDATLSKGWSDRANNGNIEFTGITAGSYSVKVANKNCTSSKQTLKASTAISETPDERTYDIDDNVTEVTNNYCMGDVTFSAIDGAPGTSYQWKINGSNVGGNSSAFTPNTTHAGSNLTLSVRYEVVGSCSGTAEYDEAEWTGLTFSAPTTPNVSISPGTNTTVCSGTEIDFSFSVTGATDYTYEWSTGETSETISRTINANDIVTGIEINVNDACVTKTTDADNVEYDIHPGPDAVSPSVGFPTSYCEGSTATIVIQNPQEDDVYYIEGSASLSKDWDDRELNGNIEFLGITAGTYSVKVANENCVGAKVTLKTATEITETPDERTYGIEDDVEGVTNNYCIGDVTFSATDGASGTSYQWKINGSNVGTNSASFTPTSTNSGSSLTLSVRYEVVGSCSGTAEYGTHTWTGITLTDPSTWYYDFDGDGYHSATQSSCTDPGEYWVASTSGFDCDDTEGGSAYNSGTVWYRDFDNDGYYSETATQCEAPSGAGWSIDPENGGSDCNDTASGFNYNPATIWYEDVDDDGYYTSTISQCNSPGADWSISADSGVDCDDLSPDLTNNCSLSASISGTLDVVSGHSHAYTASRTVAGGYWILSSGGTIDPTTVNTQTAQVEWDGEHLSEVYLRYGFDISRLVDGGSDLETEFRIVGEELITIYDFETFAINQESTCDDVIVSHTGSQADVQYYWQTSETGEDLSNAENPREFFAIGTHYLRPYHNDGVWGDALSKEVTLTISPDPVELVNTTILTPSLTDVTMYVKYPSPILTYTWMDEDGHVLGSGSSYTVTGVDSDQTHYVSAVNSFGCESPSFTPVNIIIDEESGYNWIQSSTYNNEGKISEAREYFELAGNSVQTQAKLLSAEDVLVSATTYDGLQRPTKQSMTAPVGSSDFQFNTGFLSESPTPGTLRWYYSDGNTWEPKVDITTSPFIITEFYDDGTGDIKTTEGPLEAANPNMKTYSRNFPVMGELDGHYLQVRDALLGYTSVSLEGKLFKTVLRDANGKEMITFTDINGNTLASAYGFLAEEDNRVTWPLNFIFDASTNDIQMLDFHVPEGSTASVTGGGVTDMISDVPTTGTLSQGFYRYQDPVSFNYTYSYYNASFNFYDDRGRLLISVPPMGVQDILSRSVASIDAVYVADIPFATYYTYDFQGRLLEMREPDAGVTKYMYRRDGSIRFSENALQRERGTFSYTNYDVTGRPIESGEYVGSSHSYGTASVVAALEVAGFDGGFISEPEDRKDWMRTHYDHPDDAPTAVETFGTVIKVSEPVAVGVNLIKGQSRVLLTVGFQHNAVEDGSLNIQVEGSAIAPNSTAFTFEQEFTSRAVSYTESPTTKTWYSYDEQGRLVEMNTWYKYLLDAPKTIQYEYDFLGNVTKVKYQPQEHGEQFFHAYDYDADTRLIAVYASADESLVDNRSASVLQASYEYYLHGPLKRVELAENLQGIDFVYNIVGQLKSINDPDDLTDETGFLQDAFAQRYEYFSGDYTRAGVLTASTPEQPTYNGNIAGVIWKNVNTAGVAQAGEYQYAYDNRYYLKNAIFDDPGSFSSASQTFRVDNLGYDPHGNIQSLLRNDASGASVDDFAYQYNIVGTNQLTDIAGYASWTYDAIGQMTEQVNQDGTILKPIYDVKGMVTEILDENNELKISYQYDDRGFRIRSEDHIYQNETLYVRDASGQLMAVYEKVGAAYVLKETPIYGTNRLGTYFKQSGTSQYELKDHLGNVRALINKQNRDTDYMASYYPFGSLMRANGQPGRFGYQGDFSEQDPETGLNHFELRAYDATVARWITVDPEREFASPYLSMANDPVNQVDPDGGCVFGCNNVKTGGQATNPDGYTSFDVGNFGTIIGPAAQPASGFLDYTQLFVLGLRYENVGGSLRAVDADGYLFNDWTAEGVMPNLPIGPGTAKSAYSGVRSASNFLRNQGVPRAIRKQVLQSFQVETISLRTAGNNTFGMRFFGGDARPLGRYLFPTFTNSTGRVGLALPSQWNTMRGIMQWQLRSGTVYIHGRAASQGGRFTGGAYQMYVPKLNSLFR